MSHNLKIYHIIHNHIYSNVPCYKSNLNTPRIWKQHSKDVPHLNLHPQCWSSFALPSVHSSTYKGYRCRGLGKKGAEVWVLAVGGTQHVCFWTAITGPNTENEQCNVFITSLSLKLWLINCEIDLLSLKPTFTVVIYRSCYDNASLALQVTSRPWKSLKIGWAPSLGFMSVSIDSANAADWRWIQYDAWQTH